ncbi:MAG: transketolase family protein [Candidatus Altimarinota bacterium]
MSEAISLQKTFGETIEKLGAKYKNLIVLDSDLSSNLHTLKFAKLYPDRHFTLAGAENTMIHLASGMMARGKIVVCCGKSVKIVNHSFQSLKAAVDLPNLNIKIIGLNSGLSNAEEGPAMCSVEDLSLIRSLPNFRILSPADAVETRQMIEYMITEYGPFYLRLPANPLPNLFDQNELYNPEICRTVHDSGNQVLIFATGSSVHQAMGAASKLESRGISSKVISISSITSVCQDKLKDSIQNSDLIVTVEDHILNGGLGSSIIEILNQEMPKKVLRMGVTLPGESGKFEELLAKNQIDAQGIYEQIKDKWLEI